MQLSALCAAALHLQLRCVFLVATPQRSDTVCVGVVCRRTAHRAFPWCPEGSSFSGSFCRHPCKPSSMRPCINRELVYLARWKQNECHWLGRCLAASRTNPGKCPGRFQVSLQSPGRRLRSPGGFQEQLGGALYQSGSPQKSDGRKGQLLWQKNSLMCEHEHLLCVLSVHFSRRRCWRAPKAKHAVAQSSVQVGLPTSSFNNISSPPAAAFLQPFQDTCTLGRLLRLPCRAAVCRYPS